jgi:hypothetical protein
MAVMDEGAARLEVNKLRLVLSTSALHLFCITAFGVALALFLATGEILFLALPIPFLVPVLPSVIQILRLASHPASAILLERDGIRLGDEILPYESIQWAELSGPAARPHVRFICVPNAHPPFRVLPFQAPARRIFGVYDTRHLDFVQEINLRVRAAGGPGIR